MHLLSTVAIIMKITFFDPPLLEPVGVKYDAPFM